MPGTGDRLEPALELAYRYLNPRERTISEVRGYLERHGIGAAATEAAIEVLVEQGFLDDARYARMFAEDKRELEQWGADRIRRTLLGRGIGRALADDLLCDTGSETELERALALLWRRFPRPPQERRERDRALGILLRKGYDVELALDALSAFARETDVQAGA